MLRDSIIIYRDIIRRGNDPEWNDINFVLLGTFNILSMAEILYLEKSYKKYVHRIDKYIIAANRTSIRAVQVSEPGQVVAAESKQVLAEQALV